MSDSLLERLAPLSEAEDSRTESLAALPELLCAWYDGSARPLPWRRGRDPYRIWVAEIMLQQTRIEAACGYFERFMEAFPDISALASASADAVLKQWEGLGYYSRARNLKAAADLCAANYGGRLPESFAELRKLPGIGDYTAGAIASVAFGENVPAVDGNVLRVLARFLADGRNVLEPELRREYTALIQTLPKERPGVFNEALMELGETVCLPHALPHCVRCPLESLCAARREGLEGSLPLRIRQTDRRIEELTVFVQRFEGKLALRRRPEKGLLAGLYELPHLPGLLELPEAAAAYSLAPEDVTELGEKTHLFTHVRWNMRGFALCSAVLPKGAFWASEEELRERFSLPTAFRQFIKG